MTTPPSLNDVTKAATRYADQRYRDGMAARQAEVDTFNEAARIAEAARDAALAENEELRRILAPVRRIRVGVNGHSTFRHSVYANDDAVFAAVMATGAAYFRDRLHPDSKHPQTALWRRLRDAGVLVIAQVSGIEDYGRENRTALAARLVEMADCLFAVETYNEPEKTPGWLDKCADLQEWVWGVVQGSPALAGRVKVLHPALRDRNANLGRDWGALIGRVSRWFDMLNVHLYNPQGPVDAAYWGSRMTLMPSFVQTAVADGSLPVLVGETGHDTASPVGMKAPVVTPEVQASWTEASIRFLDSVGAVPVVYELLDDPEPDTDPATPEDYQGHWGAFYCPSKDPKTWSAKPLVATMKALGTGVDVPPTVTMIRRDKT